jgi:2-keto-4-pentenoate hydratase/2-oxohepta-3-ene-1,7-dioic acid hydratase in catechol pathway
VTADELPRGAVGLKIETRVDGETRRSNNTANMIFKVADSISYMSKGMTLEPSDVIAMGTTLAWQPHSSRLGGFVVAMLSRLISKTSVF